MKSGDKVLVKLPKGFGDKFNLVWVEGKVIGETAQGLKVYTEVRRKAHPYPWAKIKELV